MSPRPADLRLWPPVLGLWLILAMVTRASPGTARTALLLVGEVMMVAVLGLTWGLRLAGGLVSDTRSGWTVRCHRARRILRLVLLVGVLCWPALFAVDRALHAVEASPAMHWAKSGQWVQLRATVATDPQRVAVPWGQGREYRFVVREVLLSDGHREVMVPARLIVRAPDCAAMAAVGGVVHAAGRLSESTGWLGPHRSLATIRLEPGCHVAAPTGSWAVAEHARTGLRRAAAVAASSRLGSVTPSASDAAALLPALGIGDTSAQSPELIDQMRGSGLMHLSAVSGANVSIVVVAAMGLLSFARLPPRWRIALTLAVVLGFVVLARPQPSVLRAALMGVMVLVLLGRRASPHQLLALAVWALLSIDPWLSRDYSLLLSALATAGLLLLVPAMVRAWRGVLGETGALLVAVPASATLATAPVIWMLDPVQTWLAVPANIAVAPAVPVATISALSAACFSFAPPVASSLALPGVLACGWIVQVARFAADPRWQSPLPQALPPLVWGLLLWLAVALLWWAVRRRPADARTLVLGAMGKMAVEPTPRLRDRLPVELPWVITRRSLIVGAVTLVALGLVLSTLLNTVMNTARHHQARSEMRAHWRVINCDVGQGDALLLRSHPSTSLSESPSEALSESRHGSSATPTAQFPRVGAPEDAVGVTVAIDVGGDRSALLRCLRDLRITKLDALFLTHPHQDHIAALEALLDSVPVRRLYLPRQASVWNGTEALAQAAGVPVAWLSAGDRIQGPGMHLQVLWPPALPIGEQTPPQDSSEVNNGSLVLRVDLQGPRRLRVLALGDVEPETQWKLLAPGVAETITGVDVVKVAHHGSKHQVAELYAAASARLAVISVGANDYGHPHPSALALLKPARIVRTDVDGAVGWCESATSVWVCSVP